MHEVLGSSRTAMASDSVICEVSSQLRNIPQKQFDTHRMVGLLGRTPAE